MIPGRRSGTGYVLFRSKFVICGCFCVFALMLLLGYGPCNPKPTDWYICSSDTDCTDDMKCSAAWTGSEAGFCTKECDCASPGTNDPLKCMDPYSGKYCLWVLSCETDADCPDSTLKTKWECRKELGDSLGFCMNS